VLWTDDDVQFSRNWIASYVNAARRWPQASFFGGQIIPRFLDQEPAWLRPAWPVISGVYAARELGDEPFAFDHKRLPFGANMAVRVAMQKQYRYDPKLGRRGELLLAGEETALVLRWLADGHIGMWVPDARVDHLITPDRLEPDHIRRFYFGVGESKRSRGVIDWLPVRTIRGLWYITRAMIYESLSRRGGWETGIQQQMKLFTRAHFNWGRAATQWRTLPQWLLPGPMRRLKAERGQPRTTVSESVLSGIASKPPGQATGADESEFPARTAAA
jgi:hypothetical protein